MIQDIIYWRIFCTTEGIWTYGYLDESAGAPTTCFTDTGHAVNGASQQEITRVENSVSKVKIQEESVETGGHFRCEGKKITAIAGQTTCQIVSWPYPISVLQSFFITDGTHEGDVIDVTIGPNTTIGSITENVAVDDTVVNVSLTVVQNISLGYDFIINSDNLGKVTEIDPNALTITIDSGSTNSYTSGDSVKTQVSSIEALELDSISERYTIGGSKTGGKYLPANTNVEVCYTNNGVSDITFRYQIEYLY